MDRNRENYRVEYNDGHIYLCFYCDKILEDKDDLKIHLDDDHEESVEDTFLDGPQFRIRKLQFYQQQVSYYSFLF